jgi:hypothetical protein
LLALAPLPLALLKSAGTERHGHPPSFHGRALAPMPPSALLHATSVQTDHFIGFLTPTAALTPPHQPQPPR